MAYDSGYVYRDIGPLIRAWERHYRLRGFDSARMSGIARDKARRGKRPPRAE